MRKSLSVTLVITVLLAVSACTNSPSPLATEQEDVDGKNFTAQPDHARLYIIQGVEKQPISDTPTVIVGSAPAVIGVAVGQAIKAAINQPEEPKDPLPDPTDKDNAYRHVPIPLPNDVYINDQKIATIGEKQYIALDLPPGTYGIKMVLSTTWQQYFGDAKVDLPAGSVSYLLTTETANSGSGRNERAIVSCAPADCQDLVRRGRRVSTTWK